MTTLENKEKLKLIPFLGLLLSLILGILLGVWSLLFVSLLLFKNLRTYVLVVLFGAALNMFVHGYSSPLEDSKPYNIKCEITKPLFGDVYEVKVLSFCEENDTIWKEKSFDAILEFYVKSEAYVFRYDTIEALVYPEKLVKTSRDKSYDNTFLHRGYTQRLVAYPDKTAYFTKYKLSDNFLASLRLKIKNRLSELLVYTKNSLVLQRMILGEANKSAKYGESVFREAGIAHILAISGLHIGILCVLLNLLLFFMNYVFELRVVKVLLVSILMFLYVWLIDFQPSALRAVLMFSLLSYGTLRAVSPMMKYNILFGTAFVMLLFDTNLLYDIGFQLSFVSILGIMYGITKFVRYVHLKNKLVNYVLISCVVTLSAQIATFPLVLYYFGSFSAVSLFTNLLIAPLIMPLLVLTLIFIFTGFKIVGMATCDLLEFIVSIAESFVNIPYSNFMFIDFRFEDLIAFYVGYLFILVGIELKNRK